MIKDDETFYLVTGKALSGSATARMPATPAVVHAPKDSVSESAAEPERQP